MHIQKTAVRHTDCGFSIQRTGPARINARVLPIRSKWNLENYLFKESFFDIFFAADIGYGVARGTNGTAQFLLIQGFFRYYFCHFFGV